MFARRHKEIRRTRPSHRGVSAGSTGRRKLVLNVSQAGLLLAALLTPITLLTPAANAASVQLGTIEAAVSDHKGTTSDYTGTVGDSSNNSNCIRYSTGGTGASSTSSGYVTNPNEAQTAHGRPCSTSINLNTQSAVGVAPVASNPTVNDGVAFPLSLVTHYNNPINADAEYYTGNLSIRLDGFDTTPTLTYPWRLWETSNNASPCAFPSGPNQNGCADQIVFPGQVSDQILTKDDITYKLVINGFAPVAANTTTCPTTMPASTKTEFLTAERENSKACVYATLVQVRSLNIVKKVTSPTGAAVPVTPFDYTSTSDLDGSPWKNGSFSLNPTVTNPAETGPKELLQGETVSVTEALPASDTWALTDISCVDGKGAVVPTTSKNLGTGTFSLKAAAPADTAAGPITCTYTNAFTPKANLTLVKKVDGGTLPVSDWTLTATGPTSGVSGKTGAAAVTNKRVTAGVYTLSETGPTTGYVPSAWTCTGASVSNGKVTLANGDNATCTITNRFSRGTFQITKTVDGPAGGFTGSGTTPFTGTYTCLPSGGGNFSVTQNSPWTSPQLPAGTKCTVTETKPTGNLTDSSWAWNDPTYGPGGDTVTITDGQTRTVAISNSYAQKTGLLMITKKIGARSGAVVSDYTGTRTFPITYTCKIGATTVKTGTVNLAKDASTTVTGVPATSLCALSEPTQTTQNGDFTNPAVAWDGYDLAPASVTITDGQTASATLTNYLKRETGSLILAKRVEGSGYTGGQAKNFTVDWACGTEEGSVDLANGGTATINNVPARTSCTVTEADPSGNLQPGYEWGTPTYEGLTNGTVTVPANGTKTVTVVNPTSPIYGKVSVTKALDGETQGVKGDATFDLTVACDAPAKGQTGNYNNTFNLAVGNPGTTPDLQVGTTCTVSEGALTQDQLVDDSYQWGPKPSEQSVTVDTKDQTVPVTVTNKVNRAYGSLAVTKVVQGMNGVNGSGVTFSGSWSCVYGNDNPVTGTWTRIGAGGATMNGSAGQILLTSACTVTETGTSGPPSATDPSYVWGAATYDPDGGTVTVTRGTNPAKVTVTNPVKRTFGAFTVSKSVTGGEAGTAFVDGDFTFAYTCTPKSGSPISGTLTSKAGATAQLPTGTEIPVDSLCVVTETGKPAAKDPYTWDGSSIAPNDGEFTVTGDTPVSVQVTNEISPKTVTVRGKKVVEDTTPAGFEGGIDFDLSLSCSLNGNTTTYGPVPVSAGGTGDFTGVLLGSSCTITEVAPAAGEGLTDVSFAWGTPTFSDEQTISSTTETFTFTATNHVKRVRGPIALVKNLVDPDQVTAADRTYSGDWTCTHSGDADVNGTWTVNGAGTASLAGLPEGGILLNSTCAPTEAALDTPPSADSSYYWGDPVFTNTTTSAGATATMEVTNKVLRHTGKLAVKKVLSGETDGYSGTGKQFKVDYTCSAQLDGQGDITGSVDVAAGADPITLVEGVPTGWDCVVAEDGASLTQALLVDRSFAWGTPSVSQDGEYTVGSESQTVTVTNPIERRTGSFGVTKALKAGTPEGVVNDDAVFTGDYQCVYNDEAIQSGTWTVTGTGAATLDPAATGLPASTICSATEDEPSEDGLVDAGWTWLDPDVSDPVTVESGTTPIVTVSNAPKRVYGSLEVTKVFDGDEVALEDDATVDGSWTCTIDDEPVGGGTWELPASGGTVNLFGTTAEIPVTAECTVVENTPEGGLVDGSYAWNDPTYNPEGGTVTLTRGDSNQVTVTNSVRRVYGEFDVAKVVDLPEDAVKATGVTFSGDWTCTYGSDEAKTGTWTITDEGSQAIVGANILVGSVCEITGEDAPMGDPSTDPSYVWDGYTVAPETVTVGAGDASVVLTVTNETRRETTGLTITKSLVGDTGGQPEAQTYDMSYQCTDASEGTWSGENSITAGEIWTTETDIPLGSSCTVTEGDLPDLTPRSIWGPVQFDVTGAGDAAVTEGQTVGFTLPARTPEEGVTAVAVTVTNNLIRQEAGYILNKTSDPASGTQVNPGDTITYTVTVTSTGKGSVDDVSVVDDLAKVSAHADVTDVSASQGTATLAANGKSLTWDLGTVSGAGTVYTLTYKAKVHVDAWDVTLKNLVTASAEQPPGDCETCTTTTTHKTPPAPKPPVVTPPVVTPPTGGTPNLPNSGASGMLTWAGGLGLLLLVSGAGALFLGRRKEA